MSSRVISAKSQRNRIRQNGFVRGYDGGSNRCCDCERACGRGWWVRVSYEYDEWECYCRECAYARVSQYDDFDDEAAVAMMNSFNGDAKCGKLYVWSNAEEYAFRHFYERQTDE